jgi:hypothetical protein
MQVSPHMIGAGFNYTGPNQAQVEADNQAAIAGGGLTGGFKMADILTDNDKTLTGWQPGKINQLAIAVANYRYSGAITGEVTPQFVNAIKTSIANTGGYPADPSSLLKQALAQGPAVGSASLAPDTFNALLSIVNSSDSNSGSYAA